MSQPVFAAIVFTSHPENGSITSFVKVDGRECFLKAIDPFLNREPITQIFATFTPDNLESAKTKYGSHLMFVGVKVAAGQSVFDQMQAAGAKLSPDVTHVIVHDGARCCVAFSDVDALLEAASTNEAVALTGGVNAPAIEFDASAPDQAVKVIEANRLKSLVFPQVFSKRVFDDIVAGKALPSLGQLKLIDGHPLNQRLNHPSEAGLMKFLSTQLPKPKATGPLNPFEEAQW
jgi:2-C-methyl-D-erythritol 4-phosphate cytidylyltransferase